MRTAAALLIALFLAPVAGAQSVSVLPRPLTRSVRIFYRAHGGVLRPAWLLLPADYNGRPIPLVISPHGRGIAASGNVKLWGDLPGQGGFAVINPAGEGRRTRFYSWGDPGEISDLARMPAIVRAHGVNVDPHRIYAIGGSMGGQETLLLVARFPHLLAGAVAFDPATDMRRRYYDFASLPDGRFLQRMARLEFGGTPAQNPRSYILRSPDHYARQIARSGVPLQLYWSPRDRVIADQVQETGALASAIHRDNARLRLWDFRGQWEHSAEMRPTRRLPRALARFGLLPWRDVPPLRPTRLPKPAF